MTGPEHYVEAERLLAGAEQTMTGARTEQEMDDALEITVPAFRAAQVHATLALVAATVNIPRDGMTLPFIDQGWRQAVAS